MGEFLMDVKLIKAAYIGHQQAVIESNGRTFVVNERTKVDQADAKLCPIELIAVSLGA